MKKYLTLAAVLGALAFLSASYIAKAADAPSAEKVAPAAATPATPAAPAAAADKAVAPAAAGSYAKDRAECDALASAATTEGAAPSDADKAAALKKCLEGKGHSDDEIAKEEAAKAPAAPATPATPAAPAAPAAK